MDNKSKKIWPGDILADEGKVPEMTGIINKKRIYALLMSLGAIVLLFRTLKMLFFENSLGIVQEWVIGLLILEMIIDVLCLIFSIVWIIKNTDSAASVPLRFGAAATFLHAVRVLVYMLGRTGPWINFDVKPEFHSSYVFSWFWVYFAGILAFCGVAGVVIIWLIRRSNKK